MTPFEEYQTKKAEITKKLMDIQLPTGTAGNICWTVGNNLRVSGVTVKNYLSGKVGCGMLAEAIYKEIKLLAKDKSLEIVVGK